MKKARKQDRLAREHFQRGDYRRAIDIYYKWINKLEDFRLSSEEEQMKVEEMLISMLQSLSICYNKINQPGKACLTIKQLERLTSIDRLPKALHAKGKAKMMFNDYAAARKYLEMARRLDPTDKAVVQKIVELNKQEESEKTYKAEMAILTRQCEEEERERERQKQIKTELKKQEDEAQKIELEVFKGKLENLIEEFKNSATIKNRSLLNDMPTHYHVLAAIKLCKEHQIELRWTRNDGGESVNFYLKKIIPNL